MIDEAILNSIKELERDVEELVTDDKLGGIDASLSSSITAINMFNGTVGNWPMSVTNSSAQAVDLANSNNLSNTGSALFSTATFVPSIAVSSGKYLSHVDAADFDILGTEAHIANKGLTLGAWVKVSSTASNQTVIAKWAGAGTRSYILSILSSGSPAFFISNNGTAVNSVTSSGSVTLNEWNFIVGRYDRGGGGLSVWINDTRTDAATSYTSIFNSTSTFNIGVQSDGTTEPLTGDISLAFLTSSFVTSMQVNSYFEISRALFAV